MATPMPERRVSRRIAAIAESATLAVDAKAKALKAAGEPVIGFGAGEPDFPTPDHIVEAAVAACRDPANHRYTPAGGLPELKEAIAAKTARDCGLERRRRPGAGHQRRQARRLQRLRRPCSTRATRCCSRRRTGPPTPSRSPWPAASPVVLPTDETTGFRVTVEQLEAARTDRTKVLLFVSPSNPTGAVYPRGRGRGHRPLGRRARHLGGHRRDLRAPHLRRPRASPRCPPLVPELADRCVVLNGVAKTYAMTGWRVGWMIGPADVIKAATNLQSHATSNVANVAQRAALAAVAGDLDGGGRDARRLRPAGPDHAPAAHRDRRASPASSRRAPSTPSPTSSGAARPPDPAGAPPTTTLELADVILDEAKVAIVPGEAFGAPGYARLSLRPRRRRPRRGRRPHRRPARRGRRDRAPGPTGPGRRPSPASWSCDERASPAASRSTATTCGGRSARPEEGGRTAVLRRAADGPSPRW